jgi:hypothetical protein
MLIGGLAEPNQQFVVLQVQITKTISARVHQRTIRYPLRESERVVTNAIGIYIVAASIPPLRRTLAKLERVCFLVGMETVATFSELAEAQVIRSVLEGHGIDSVIPNEQIAEIAPPYLWASGGIQLQVAEEDLALAKEVLATLVTNDDDVTDDSKPDEV